MPEKTLRRQKGGARGDGPEHSEDLEGEARPRGGAPGGYEPAEVPDVPRDRLGGAGRGLIWRPRRLRRGRGRRPAGRPATGERLVRIRRIFRRAEGRGLVRPHPT